MIKSGLFLSAGNGFAACLSLVRNIVIARLISVEDFGIASTFAVTMALIEMSSNIAIDRLIVQARDGDTERLQSTAQLLQVGRGVLGAIVLFLVAAPLAALFGVRDATWAYQAMAVVPLLRGFAHLDMFRLQREMRFMPSVTAETAAQFMATAAAVPLALALGDYSAMLYALLVQQLVYVAASHAVAVRPYRLAFARDIAARALSFGWPLLLNGLLMFAILHGDRVIIGGSIGMTELGWFSAALTLTLMPTLLICKTLQSFFLPQLARVQDDSEAFGRLQVVMVEVALLIGAIFVAAFALAGPAILVGLYGPRYEAAVAVLVWLAVLQGVRIARAGATIVALAKAETRIPFAASLLRVSVLPIAWIAVEAGGGVGTVIILGILGEGLATIASLLLLRRRVSFDLGRVALPIVATAAMFGLSCLLPLMSEIGFPDTGRIGGIEVMTLAGGALATLLALQLWSMRALRNWSAAVFLDARRSLESP